MVGIAKWACRYLVVVLWRPASLVVYANIGRRRRMMHQMKWRSKYHTLDKGKTIKTCMFCHYWLWIYIYLHRAFLAFSSNVCMWGGMAIIFSFNNVVTSESFYIHDSQYMLLYQHEKLSISNLLEFTPIWNLNNHNIFKHKIEPNCSETLVNLSIKVRFEFAVNWVWVELKLTS